MGIFNTFKKMLTIDINSSKEFTTDGTCDTYYNFCGDTNYRVWDKRYKNSNTDFSNVVFLDWISYKKIFSNNFDDYSKFISYDLDIKNPVKKYKDFIDKGYLKKASLEVIFEAYKVIDLKNILRENNLKVSGKKSELISRIISSIEVEKLKGYIHDDFYEITTKGTEYIKKYEYYIKLYHYRNFCIGPKEFDRCRNSFDCNSPSFYDVMLKILDARITFFKNNSSYGLLRNSYHNKSILLKDLGLNKESFKYLLHVAYIDLSGICNDNHIYSYKDMIFPPGIAQQLYNNKQYFDLNLVDEVFAIKLPFRYFEKDTFIDIINDVFNGEEVNFNKYKNYKNTKSKFKAMNN